jgi:hypothetical protein
MTSAVYRHSLPTFLHEKLGEPASNQAQDPHTASVSRALPAAEDLDAHLSMPSEIMKKMKHKQKQIVLEKAVDSVADALANASSIPLCALPDFL